ncbi:MAG: class I SAM-dependent methyltransferase [Phycisphaerae bacterium]|nr:class I SAM-dependent methyltransferase [Phycisphaerae bacterium]
MSLYATPSLYRAFFDPSDEMRASIDALVRMHRASPKQARPRRVIDPACGPATWLAHFAAQGATAVGIDIEPKTVAAANVRLAAETKKTTKSESRANVVVGDMRSPPPSVVGPFDLAINPDNSVGHLGGLADVAAHLRAMHALLCDAGPGHGRSHGAYVVGLAIREPKDSIEAATVYERGPVELEGGGFAALRSETRGLVDVKHPDGLRCERIRHLIMTTGADGLAPFIVEQYDLLTFPLATLQSLLSNAGPWKIVDCRDATDESLPRKRVEPGCGDVLLVLRPVDAAHARGGGKRKLASSRRRAR